MSPSPVLTPEQSAVALPDHTQLPCKDDRPVNNFQEHPQSALLTGCLMPRLHELYPDGQFCIGEDCGIYYLHTQPPLDGCRAPDWFLVPGVPPMLDGRLRRSYVMWQEPVRPLILIEYVSGDGREERDTTPLKGKFWIYEQAIAAGYYAIYEVEKAAVELFALERGRYRPVSANAAGRFPVEPLGIELGIWQGTLRGMDLPWLRVWDAASGQLLPTPEERAEAERLRAENEKQRAETAESLLDDARQRLDEECERAETERKRAATLEAKLRELGIDPNAG